MTRVEIRKWHCEMLSPRGRWARVRVYATEFVIKTAGGSGPLFTVKQARRLAKWLTERCDEIERQADE